MRQRAIIFLLLLLVPIVVFSGVFRHEFVAWDDNILIFENPHLLPATLRSVSYFWTYSYDKLYVPLTYGSYVLLAMFAAGKDGVPTPLPFHLLNLLLHVGNTVLVYAILRLLVKKDCAAAAGALLWAMHPVQVEPVAWASELKGVLSGFFELLALFFYLRWAQGKGDAHAEPGAACCAPTSLILRLSSIYILSTLCFVAALLSKPSAVALPLVGLILDRYAIGRNFKQATQSIALWIAICVPWVLVTQHVQPVRNDDIRTALWQRPLIAGDALTFYLGKLLWPLHLAPDYGRTPNFVLSQPWHWLTPLVSLLLFIVLWRQRRRWPQAAIAAGIGLAFLLPVLGLFPFHFQIYSTVADRYLYLAMLGPAFLLAWLLGRYENRALKGAVAVVLIVLAVWAALQTNHWRNSETLFAHTLHVNPRSWMAHNNLGGLLAQAGQPQAALEHFKAASELKPDDSDIHFNLGHAYQAMGQPDNALQEIQRALQANPHNVKALNDLGVLLFKQGKLAEAEEKFRAAITAPPGPDEASDARAEPHANLALLAERRGDKKIAQAEYEAALRLKPRYADAHNRLGSLLMGSGDLAGAEQHLKAAITADPKLAAAHANLGVLLAGQGKPEEAIGHFAEAVDLNPNDAQSQYNLGALLNSAGQSAAAIGHLREAVRLKPDMAEAYNDLGTALAKQRQPEEAIVQLREAIKLSPKYAQAHFNLGLILIARHQPSAARDEWLKALQIDPTFKSARDALARNHL